MSSENKNIIVGDDGSYFDGGYLAYIGYNIAVAFVTGVTFGIAHPWMKCWYQKWLASHTVINGKRMTFDGKGGDLFVKYIIWLLLCYVTCGIYGFWMNVALKKWISERTHFENEPDNNSFFDGRVGDYFITSILSALALLVPFAGVAWSRVIITRWFINHTVIDSRRLTFRGTVGDLFIKYLLWGILTSITCGIFGFFVPVKYIKWETEHTFDENCTPEAYKLKANYKTQIHTDAVMLQSGDSTQLESIKAQMISEANEGLANEDLEKLESALRFADILKECGCAFDQSDDELIYNCTILERKLKSIKPVQTKSKLWVVIVAAVVAFLMFIGVIGGALAAVFMLMPSTATRNPAVQQSSQEQMTREAFYRELEAAAKNYNCTLTEVAAGDGTVVYAMRDSIPNSYVEIAVETVNGYVNSVGVYGQRQRGELNNIYIINNAVKCVYKAIGLDYIAVLPDVYEDSQHSYDQWNIVTESGEIDISVEFTK